MKSILSIPYITALAIGCMLTTIASAQNETLAPPPPPPVVQEPVNEGDPYTYVETMPDFVGGRVKMYEHLHACLEADTTTRGLSGMVVCRFVIDVDGTITKFEIARSPNPVMSVAAERCITNMPAWTPGEHNGKKVPVQLTIPIRFVLQ